MIVMTGVLLIHSDYHHDPGESEIEKAIDKNIHAQNERMWENINYYLRKKSLLSHYRDYWKQKPKLVGTNDVSK